LEQALSLPSATLRFAQLGWRVIRVEATPSGNNEFPGDPNRYIGQQLFERDRRSFFLAPNLGKQSIALNLREKEGQQILHRIIRSLNVDVFCCNTLPGRYESLGIDYGTLRTVKPDIIWAGISAMGPEYPDVPGYDPVLQAMAGFMELTGDPAGPPMLMGLPLVDLKAGDELYAAIWKALAERAETGQGASIDVSMLQCAASWLITTLPALNFDHNPAEITRSGNQNCQFVPTGAFPAKDGYVYIAVGNDLQWRRLASVSGFEAIATPARNTNDGRQAERKNIYEEITKVTSSATTTALTDNLSRAGVPHAAINNLPQVLQLEAIKSRLTSSVTPDGRTFFFQPMAIDTPAARTNLPFAPRYGEHTDFIMREIGFTPEDSKRYLEKNIIAADPFKKISRTDA